MMKNTSITFDQYRRNIRRELFKQRQADRDLSETRLTYDAKQLDAKLKAQGFVLPYITEWGRSRATTPFKDNPVSPLQADIATLFDCSVA
jgi:hypothetical protein